MSSCGTFQKLRPLSLLSHLASCYDSAHLKVFNSSVSWSIYLNQGKLIYASHSIDSFDRIDCHLRRLSHQIPTITSEARTQLRIVFEADLESNQDSDYQAICWLVKHQYLNPSQAAILIEGLVKEVLESFLLVKEGKYELGKLELAQEFCKLELQPLVEHCQNQLQGWKDLGEQIWSPYQRPYFLNRDKNQRLLPEIKQKLSAMLKGFSFRHLAILLNQDELQLAQSLYPYIVSGAIVLDDPHSPFEKLPRTFERSSLGLETLPNMQPGELEQYKPEVTTNAVITNKGSNLSKLPSPAQLPEIPVRPQENALLSTQRSKAEQVSQTSNGNSNILIAAPTPQISYTIVCVDDSPVMLKEISYFLNDESFSVVAISDSVKALMQIIRHKPDLILLDVNMAGINGYELCRLLRNHSLFKSKPIIMVTGNTGIIDRVKARLVGASGYLTKPFTQSDLLKIVFRHLF